MKKTLLIICLICTYQCDIFDLEEEEIVDLSISFISTEPTYLIPGSDIIVNYSISNPSNNEITSKFLWVDIFSYNSQETLPDGYNTRLYEENFIVPPGDTEYSTTLDISTDLILQYYDLYLDIRHDDDPDQDNNFMYVPINAHIGETIFEDNFNSIDRPLSNYSNQDENAKWDYNSNNFDYVKISGEQLEIKGNDTTGFNEVWDYVLIDTKLTEKFEFDANLGFISLNNQDDLYYGIVLGDWNSNLSYYLLLYINRNGSFTGSMRIWNGNEETWDDHSTTTDISSMDIYSSNKFELEFNGQYLYGYIGGYEIKKFPVSGFEAWGYGIIVTNNTTIWADDVGVYGNEVTREVGRFNRLSPNLIR